MNYSIDVNFNYYAGGSRVLFRGSWARLPRSSCALSSPSDERGEEGARWSRAVSSIQGSCPTVTSATVRRVLGDWRIGGWVLFKNDECERSGSSSEHSKGKSRKAEEWKRLKSCTGKSIKKSNSSADLCSWTSLTTWRKNQSVVRPALYTTISVSRTQFPISFLYESILRVDDYTQFPAFSVTVTQIIQN